MLGLSTVFLFVAIGLASGTTPVPTPSPAMYVTKTNTSSVNTSAIVPTTTSHSSNMSLSTSVSNMTASISPSLTSTTPLPTTSPTPKPTTKPTPKPKPGGDYSVKDKKGKYCLLAIMSADFVIPYEQKEGVNKTKAVQATVPMPFLNTSNAESKCDKAKPVLKISWPMDKPLYHFVITFNILYTGDKNGSNWEVKSLSLSANTVNNTDFTNATEKMITLAATNKTELHALSAGVKGYYMCKANRTYPFDKRGQLFLKYAKLQPFEVKANASEQFGEEYNCEPSPTPKPAGDDSNIVPIAVGCALAGLVLIVLIAYIIGRRKSQRGYEKV